VADAVNAATRAGIDAGSPPTLASVHRAAESPFSFYLRGQARAAQALGIRFRDEALAEGDGPDGLVRRVRALDADLGVDAILLEHPLPPPFDFRTAISAVRVSKDVDGVSPASLGLLVDQHPVHVPAVALAAVEIARHYRLPVEGERVAVVGRSETVGLPLALLLARRAPGANATVTIAHSRTPDLAAALAGHRTIFSCAGRPGLLTRKVVPKEAAVVDVGLSSVPDPERPGSTRAVGDADYADLDGWASGVTPVPGGVGPVTVAELMANVGRARALGRAEAR
jgi:methylenetetrahydrofolate dehydrogenase (NADP+) / methenyltetrahydrofolate cyclohydrolase